MTGRGGLREVPDARQQAILEWLAEPEAGDAKPVLDAAFARLHTVRQARRWPWDVVIDSLRPEPFGHTRRAWTLVFLVAALTLAVVMTALLAAGQRSEPPPTTRSLISSPAPSASTVAHPLAPTGGTLTFVDVDGRLWLINADGTNRRRIAQDVSGRLAQPDWAPDGNRLLVLDRRGGTEQVWDVDPAGSESRVVIPCADPCGARNEASYSRDGTRIAFFDAYGPDVGGFPTSCGVSVYDRATLAITRLTTSPCGIVEERAPRWSPDSTEIVFFRTRSPGGVPSFENDGDSAVFIRNVTTGEERQVTEWSSRANEVDWSPNGEWIVASLGDRSEPTGQSDLWRVRPDGTGLERLTEVGEPAVHAVYPRYTPDERWILFGFGRTDANDLWAIPADGGTAVRVLPNIPTTMEAVMRPAP